jgi:hypothetical protein
MWRCTFPSRLVSSVEFRPDFSKVFPAFGGFYAAEVAIANGLLAHQVTKAIAVLTLELSQVKHIAVDQHLASLEKAHVLHYGYPVILWWRPRFRSLRVEKAPVNLVEVAEMVGELEKELPLACPSRCGELSIGEVEPQDRAPEADDSNDNCDDIVGAQRFEAEYRDLKYLAILTS